MKHEMPLAQEPLVSWEEELRQMAVETTDEIERAERSMAHWITLLERLDTEKHDDEKSDDAYHALRNYVLMNINQAALLLDELRQEEQILASQGN